MTSISVAYSSRAHDLCRFVEDPVDERVATFVRAARQLSLEERAAIRSQLDERDCYTLIAFSKRQSASALRDGELRRALDAIDALTLVTVAKIDYRDFTADFPLYAVGQLGGDVRATVESAMSVGDPNAQSSLAGSRSRATRLTLRHCGLMEVHSRYGLGFIDTWSERYSPKADLVGASVRMADWIDAADRYVVGGLHLSGLPEVWFDPHSRLTGQVRTSGGVSIAASLDGGPVFSHGLLAFLAEVGSQETAAKLAQRANAASVSDRPRVAESRGRVILVLIGGSTTLGEASAESVETLRPMCEGLLKELDG